jgi:ketosteroid isomerase-like protein
MSTQENVQTVKDFFAAVGRGDTQGLLALSVEDIEWIIPGEKWPLAGTHRGQAGLADLLSLGGKVKATNRTFEDHFVFAITVRNGKVTNIRKYIDTQALARASRNSQP